MDCNQSSEDLKEKGQQALPQEWRKVLYDKQGVPDNFVPESFLKDLKKNGKDNQNCADM